jgi:poly-gamma-glutamate capsule biosynthesis protein CapA/YwtB (metallophosphatase superfamily)
MLAGLSRWVREEVPARLVPTRLRAPLERWTAAHAYPAAAALRWTISAGSSRSALMLGGDLALHHWRPGEEPGSVVSGLEALARTADALIVNLETQLTARSAPAGTIGTSLRADPAAIAVLSYLGVKAVTCANNHCLDYGPDGLNDSAELLEQAEIAVSGVMGEGRDGGAVVSVGGIRVGLLGFSDDWRVADGDAGGLRPAPHDPSLVRERITAMKSVADLVVVQLHWGYEWSMYPMLTLRNLARSYVESGASLVVCHHAHVPMGVETWRGGAIAHGLGNLYFGQSARRTHPFWSSSYVLRAEISSTGVVAVEALPVATDAQGRVGLDSGQSAKRMRRVIAFLSSRLGHDDYLARVEASITARHGCSVLRDLHRRVQAGDSAGVRERVRFLEPPRQRALLASLRAAGGGLARIGDFFERLGEGVVEPSAPPTRAELARLSGWAGRFLKGSIQKGRIP